MTRLLTLMPTLAPTHDFKGMRQVIKIDGVIHECKSTGKVAALLETLGPICHKDEYDAVLIMDDDVKHKPAFWREWWADSQLKDPCLGVATGNRFFVEKGTLATATRHVWGELARPFMRTARIPWGGFMLIRWPLVARFCEEWKMTLFDDTMAAELCDERGYVFKSCPLASRTPDYSYTDWEEFWEFLIRQYAAVRMCGPWWVMWTAWAVLLASTVAVYYAFGFYAIGLYAVVAIGLDLKFSWRIALAIPINQILFLVLVPWVQCVASIKWKGRWERLR